VNFGGFVFAFTRISALISFLGFAVGAWAQREPVLKQIDEPHAYYFREMYLPQLTTGPSSVAWSPDATTLVYSMAGSLWLQKVGSQQAQQLTAGPGYDYQPDCSPDGRWVVYAKYDKSRIELWALDLETKQAHALTNEGAVNVEPRFSPDGKRIAFVSTVFHGRFHIFVGNFAAGSMAKVQRITGEDRSPLPRYYYSAFDHEISPAWSPDGTELLFVSNRGHLYGTGGFWRIKTEAGAEPHEIHYEETAWKARPSFSPDGKRIVYASYLGQAWHQLWVMPAQGGDPFPLSYGDFDNINPRWSPDGQYIAFISNRDGNTSLWVQQVAGGGQRRILITNRKHLVPMGRLRITVLDENGRETASRVMVRADDGRAYAPEDAWLHADDSFDRSQAPFETHYFHTLGTAEIEVPAGPVTVEAMKGFEYRLAREAVEIKAGQSAAVTLRLRAFDLPSRQSNWISGDVHVHMNYGGAYRNTPSHLVFQAAAENLPIVQDLVVNKEQRIPDIAYFKTTPDAASTESTLLLHGQEFHTSYWGHLGLLHLTKNFLLPDYAAYANTAAASLYPTNASIADLAHAQQGLVGYVHPFDTYPDPAKEHLTDELPVDVALGKVDYIEVLGFSDHKSTAQVWYRLLNCGFRLPTAAGTDAMANFASLRGPVGLNRVYVEVPGGSLSIEPWLNNLKHGHTFATNGPLLGFSLDDQPLGNEIKLPAGTHNAKYKAWLRSIVPIDHLQIICNGQVQRELKLNSARDSVDEEGTLPISKSGWCLLRAYNDAAAYPILDLYPYATTSPIYLTVEGAPPDASEDATYFIAWIDQLTAGVRANNNWNTETEKRTVLEQFLQARKVYEELLH
jgi:TolB protein